MRQIALDTETTGLSPSQGHRLTEIGCVELIDRQVTGKTFQTYLNPERELDEGAARITGLSLEFLADKPKFADILTEFLDFIADAELIIHNAPFDTGFINHELNLVQAPWPTLQHRTQVIDTLVLARTKYPGQRNSLDALCKRLSVNNAHRDLHGALLDAEILAQVYLAMTAGQTDLEFTTNATPSPGGGAKTAAANLVSKPTGYEVPEIPANHAESCAHAEFLKLLDKQSGGACLFLNPSD